MVSEATGGDHAGKSIFLSYSRTDRERVIPLIEALEANGYSVWWDGLLKGGDRFSQVTETALETSDTVLVAWTRTSVNSDWVRDEATRGRERGRLLSVSLDGTFPPLGFRQIQVIDLSGDASAVNGAGYSEVLEALENPGRRSAVTADFSQGSSPPAGISRRTVFLAGGVGAVAVGGLGIAWTSGLFGSAGQPNSLAVMTFENLSNDPEQDYFSAGLSEELRSILSINPRLTVAAQTSSDKFSGGGETVGAIASALGVANVLEGSVRREENRLRVAVRLIDGATDLDLWSDVFDREVDDVLAVQSEIATAVVDSLIANFSAADEAGTVRIGGTDNPEALNSYLKGMALYGSSGAVEDIDRAALAAIDRAIDLDPGYGAAHAAHSRLLTSIGNRHASGEDLQSYYRRAMEAARTSIDLAPDLAEGHAALGSVLANGELNIAAARQPYEKSFELGYGNATILMRYTLFASFVGTFERGRESIARAERLDPLNSPVFRADAVLEFAARNYDGAAEAARRAISLDGDVSIAHRILADIARFQGGYDEARALYEQEPSVLSKLAGLAMLEGQAGNMDAAQEAFAKMVDQFGDNSLYQQAQVLAQWGRPDEAIATLQRALEIGDSGLVLSHTDQNLDPIRQTAAFQSLQKRLGFD